MPEYIEREAALKTLEKSLIFCESELETGEYRKGCIAAIQDDIGNIKHLPTADVVEVKHGEWEEYWDNDYMEYFHRCSKCKNDAPAKRDTYCD